LSVVSNGWRVTTPSLYRFHPPIGLPHTHRGKRERSDEEETASTGYKAAGVFLPDETGRGDVPHLLIHHLLLYSKRKPQIHEEFFQE